MCKNLYLHLYIFLFLYFSIEFFEGVSRGGPYRWSMDWSVRLSVDLVRWTGPRTGGQCFRVTHKRKINNENPQLRSKLFLRKVNTIYLFLKKQAG